jgi:NAD(P)H-hydrate epimerase
MLYFPTGSEMAAIDAYTIQEIGIPQMVLMERAALSLAEEVEKILHKGEACLVVVEGGNNGGDGVCLARILKHRGYQADVLWLDGLRKQSDAFLRQKEIAEKCGVTFYTADLLKDTQNLERYSVVVDGIFGVGLTRNITGIQAETIATLNQLTCRKLAIDIPSGINSENGSVMGIAFQADKTVTFGLKKLGMLYEPAGQYCGEIIVKDIGFPREAVEAAAPKHYCYTDDEIIRMVPPRKKDSHKGTYGRVVVIAGSVNMCGACRFAAEAAYRTGCGLVRIYTDEENRVILQESLPEAMLTTYDSRHFEEDEIAKLKSVIGWADVIVAGPGLGTDQRAETIGRVLMQEAACPLVLDADALNIISRHRDWLKGKKNVVITPHIKEMARLIQKEQQSEAEAMSYVKQNMEKAARETTAEYGVVTVLKDARTMVTSQETETYINITGNNGMSKGGSGDVLAGLIGGLLAQKMPVEAAAKAGVYLHGKAGNLAAEHCGQYSMLARDILYYIPAAMGKLHG